MIDNQARIALLIDADNSPSSKIDVILSELAKVGVANIRRAYGNWKKDGLKGWEGVLHEYAIRPIQQFDYSKGKNATDMGMVIDAMDLLYTDRPEAFGIVSSDSDFTPLVMHLKAKGAAGLRLRREEDADAVRQCVLALPVPREPRAHAVRRGGRREAGAARPPQPGEEDARRRQGRGGAGTVEAAADSAPLRLDSGALRQDARLVTLLRNAVESAVGEDGWSALGSVGQQIGNQASFDPRNYGYRKLIDLIEASQLFELDRRGSQVVLRDKRQAKQPGLRQRAVDAVSAPSEGRPTVAQKRKRPCGPLSRRAFGAARPREVRFTSWPDLQLRRPGSSGEP